MLLLLLMAAAAASADGGIVAADGDRFPDLSTILSRGAYPELLGEAIVKELRFQAPVAFVEGFWVSPIDFSSALVATGALQQSPEAPGGPRRHPLLALAFTDAPLRKGIPLPFVGDFADLPASPEPVLRVIVVPVGEGGEAVLEYVAPAGECLYFCLDPALWDFDGDGQPNAADLDDDGDGVADGQDAYPYWRGASEGPRQGTFYLGFTGKFSQEVAAAVLATYDRLRDLQNSGQAVLLGPVADEGVLQLFWPDGVGAPVDCPDPDDAAVRYVSRDPEACARIRFRCEPGEIPFSKACGCGCHSIDG